MFKLIRRLKITLNPDQNRADLHTLLVSLNPENPFEERMDTLKKLMEWIRFDGFEGRNVRLKFLLQFLERHEDAAVMFFETFKEITAKGSAVRLYCLTGIPENSGFFTELSDRVIVNLLPPIHREKDLAELFKLVFNEEDDARWFELFPDQIILPFNQLLQKHQVDTTNLVIDQTDALIILGSQISALGISRQIRRHLKYRHISNSSFFKLGMAINRNEPEAVILGEVSNIRTELEQVQLGLEHSGVSVDLIHHLEKINSLLNRIEMILDLRHSGTPVVSFFVGRLIRDELQSMGVKDFLSQNLHMLSRKIVERAGDKGGAYIAEDRKERAHLFVAASWAGGLTAFTALFKYWIGAAHFPLFIEFFFSFLNYALGFLLMQRWHLALSSKQPAYTASALSRKFEKFLKTKELSEIILEVRKVIASQLIAAGANLLWVIPVILLLDTLCLWGTGSHIVEITKAHELVEKHRLWKSLTIFHAALTGVMLWLSSVVAGWTENWIVFRSIPSLLRNSPFLKKMMGKQKANDFADKVPGTMAGIAGNLSIAFFLAAPAIIGTMTGLPIDIKHVTLGTGTIVLGFASIGWGLADWPLYLEMAFSVAVIGMLNFGVSFYCAIRLAAVARGVNTKYLKIIFKFALKKPRPEFSVSG